MQRRLPVGAEATTAGVHFRVWAPSRKRVDVVLDQDSPKIIPLTREDSGYFSGVAEEARPGSRYKYRLDGGDQFPDPASRFQPEGPHSSSEVIDPGQFRWTDRDWRGMPLEGQVIYEMHIGTFTKEGTWQRAQEQLTRLAETGITV